MKRTKDFYEGVYISDECYKQTKKDFRNLNGYIERLEKRQKIYNKKINTPIEDRIPYRSSAYIDNDVRIMGGRGSSAPGWANATIELKTEEQELLRYAIFVRALEEKLRTAILNAAMCSKYASSRPKIKDALELNLLYGVSQKELSIGPSTLAEYKRIAIIEAAEALGYITIEEGKKGRAAKEAQSFAAQNAIL